MHETEYNPVSLSFDTKKNRIRIHKSTLHLLGDPPYIQLLINPKEHIVAIKSVEHAVSGDQTHKVSSKTLRSSNSVEIYSSSFIDKLKEVTDGLDNGNLFRMEGKVIPSEGLAVFSFKSLRQISS